MTTRQIPARSACAAAVAALVTAVVPATASHAAPGDAPNDQDRTWVSDSSAGDLFEVAGGRLAMRSSDPGVRRFGRLMIRDHRKLYHATATVAQSLGLDVEDKPSRGQRAVLRDWKHLSGRAFICSYVPYEWEDHQLDIADSEDEVEDGQADAVQADAAAGLPVLHHHLDLASRLLHSRHC
jgi:putative membrane protein